MVQAGFSIRSGRSETLVFAPVQKAAIVVYSDQGRHELLGYSLEEVLAEKLRSVMQRMQARDFYDLWYLLEIQGMDPQYKGRWQQSLSAQIHDLPDFNQVEKETRRRLRRLK